MNKKIISIFVCMLLFATASSAVGTMNNEKSDAVNDVSSNPRPGNFDPGDVLFEYHVQNETGDNQMLGVEFDGTNFWATGGGASSDPNKLYKFDSTGNLLNTYDQPGHSTGWGWRDLAFDGTYLYASVDTMVDQIDPATGNYTGFSFQGPDPVIDPCRALAYDSDKGHFWTADFRSPIYEFDNNGNVYNTFSNSYPIYGMAWDDFSSDGPWLWIYDQEQENDHSCHIRQFDPVNGVYTGVEYSGVQHNPGYGTGFDMAGGAAFYDDGEKGVFVGLTQNSPDLIFGIEIGGGGGPELEIGDITGGLFTVKAEIKNVGTADATDVTWDIQLNGGLILIGKSTSGGPENISASGQITATSSLILGFGKPVVTVTADSATKDVNATVLLFFIII